MTQRRSPTTGEDGISPETHHYGALTESGQEIEAGRLPALSTAEVIAALSEGLDLAEGRPMGHAKRICYIALSMARSLGLPAKEQVAVYYAGLLHDVGVPLVSAGLSHIIGINEDALFASSPRKLPEELAVECCSTEIDAIVAAFRDHTLLGAKQIRSLGVPSEAIEAVAGSHEHWNGSGYPEGLAAQDIPLLARIVCLADWAESVIADETSSLTARRNLPSELQAVSETVLDPRLVEQFDTLSRSDDFWLGLYGEDLSRSLMAVKPHENGRSSRGNPLKLAESFAAVIDAKTPFTDGKSRRVAQIAERLAEAVGFPPHQAILVRLAGLLHDVGQLGVPARILSKPDILSLTEMQLLHRHPSYSRLTLEQLRGFEDIAMWVGAHHERLDGKGYPEMLTNDLIPLESRILAVANTYVALTSDRPYRGALSNKEALKVLRGAAGTQLDPQLVRVLCSVV